MKNIFTKKLMQLKTDWRSFCDTNRIEINNSQDRVELEELTTKRDMKFLEKIDLDSNVWSHLIHIRQDSIQNFASK